MLARISCSALRPRGEVRVPVSHRGDPASIVLRLWKAVCPQSPRSPSAVSQQHIVSEPGDLEGTAEPPPPHAEAPTPQEVLRPAPSTAAWPDGGSRPSRQRHPITCPPGQAAGHRDANASAERSQRPLPVWRRPVWTRRWLRGILEIRERGHSPSSSSFPVSRCGRREPRLRKRSGRGT